jgi:Flp pilus assembly protein TadG
MLATIRRRRTRRGGGFLLFLAVLLPLTLVGVALSTDYTRVILAKRQVTNTADIVAMAAATALFERGETVSIDADEAERRATEAFVRAVAAGMLPGNLEAELVAVTVCSDGDDCPVGQEVTVDIEYDVPGFFVVRVAAPGVEDDDVSGNVRRSARICDPQNPPTPAGCAYPVGR